MNGISVTLALMGVALRIDAIGQPDAHHGATAALFAFAILVGVVGAAREWVAHPAQ